MAPYHRGDTLCSSKGSREVASLLGNLGGIKIRIEPSQLVKDIRCQRPFAQWLCQAGKDNDSQLAFPGD